MKTLSIITICYNEPDLAKTCESIVNQTWQDFEWVVIDGKSNAETQAIWNKYKYRINKFVSEKDSGLYNAMNKGIKLATGKYLNFMNAGDFFYDHTVLEDFFKNKTQTADVLYGNCALFSQKKKKWKVEKPFKDLFCGFAVGGSLNHQSTFIKKDLFNRYGLYDEQLKVLGDYDGFVRFFINKAKFTYVNRIVACFDTTGISSTSKELLKRDSDLLKGKYFSKEQVLKARNKTQIKYTLLERIFSIKNTCDKMHKIITIFNIHIKIPCTKRRNT